MIKMIKNRQYITMKKFDKMDFEVGDIFTEDLKNWIIIIDIQDEDLSVIEGQSINNYRLDFYTPTEFKSLYKDGSNISFYKNDKEVAKKWCYNYFLRKKREHIKNKNSDEKRTEI